ncbi:6-phosphogluconolactonase [Fulvimonas sp. R45]|uniref:6-phosphogluconolactonase n=1 Tax=Fulvimonas sp. R45 TaxID=3045937 RepID=UPI00265E72DE|nr:6-phosphogluconolactonase [Fulvimonas sp. R45]MDO1528834.1 6-phosphogluconolactonase [Fulvimonas sp. R45]
MISRLSPRPQLRVHADADAMTRAAADAFVATAQAALAAHGRFGVALAGGGTPKPLYELLAAAPYRDRLDWSRVEVFFGDERCVPPDSPRSNYRMAHEALLSKVPLPPANVHRLRGEDEPALAALAGEQDLRHAFRRDWPRFDLVLLGIGDNGHTASLFPGCACLRERERAVCAQYVESQHEWRLTLTLPVLDAAAAVWLLADGAGKADVLAQVLDGPWQPDVLPMQYVAPAQGEYVWWLDRAAAARLSDA